MVNSRVALSIVDGFRKDLVSSGLDVYKMVLFGSFVKGNYHKDSDIDLAIWSSDFSGNKFVDIEKIAAIKANYGRLEVHMFHSSEDESNPFIAEILKTGRIIRLD